jgi:hypothetical protein
MIWQQTPRLRCRFQAAWLGLSLLASVAAPAWGQPGPRETDRVATWLEELKADSRPVRERAVKNLYVYEVEAQEGRLPAEAALPLVEALDDENYAVAGYSATVLSHMGDRSRPTLLEAIQHERRGVRLGAIGALSNQLLTAQTGDDGPRPDEVAGHLVAALKDSDQDVRAASSDTLAVVGTAAIPRLLDALRSNDGPNAKPGDKPEKEIVVNTLAAICTYRGGASTLIEALADPDPGLHDSMIEILASAGWHGQILADAGLGTRMLARLAGGGPALKTARELRRAREHPNSRVREGIGEVFLLIEQYNREYGQSLGKEIGPKPVEM